MYQKVILIGVLGREIEMRYTPQGKAVCDFSLATKETWGSGESKQENTTWWKCVAWEKRAETLANYLHTGSKVMLEGTVESEAWIDKSTGEARSGLKLTVREFKFLDSKADSENRQQQQQEAPRQNQKAAARPSGKRVAEEIDDDGGF